MLKRTLGKTRAELSLVGMGGIVLSGFPQSEADRMVSEAVDRGVCYFDVAPTYGDSQYLLGPALAPYRDQCFLACKTVERTAADSAGELEESLRALRTDHVDVYQLHGLASLEDVEKVFTSGGAMETFVKAKEEGKARFLGFTAHSTEAALEALRRYPFDSVLFPFNFVCWYQGRFGPEVMEAAQRAGAGRLALKAMARTFWPEGGRKYEKTWYEPLEDSELAALALRWTLSLDVTATLPPGEPSCFWRAVAIAEQFRPIEPEETARLKELAKTLTPVFPQ